MLGARSSSVGLLVVALTIGCTPNTSFAPSIDSASPRLTAPSPTSTLAGPPTTSASRSAVPIGPSPAWVDRSLKEESGFVAGLAATTQAGSLSFHALVSEEEVLDDGLDAEVYLRTRDEGRTWGERRLIRGTDSKIATAGQHVYVATYAYECGGVGVLRNNDDGRAAAWSVPSCLTRNRDLDSEWAPEITATASDVYVTSVDQETNDVAVWVSHDSARTWTRQVLGKASLDGCCIGPLKVAATNDLVAVTWTDGGVTMTRISSDGGSEWGGVTRLSIGYPTSASARDSRLAFGGAGPTGSSWASILSEGQWESVEVPSPQMRSDIVPDASSIALGPEMRFGVLYCESAASDGPNDPVWVAAVDGAPDVNWGTPERLPGGCVDFPAVVWTDDGILATLIQGDEESPVLAVRR